MDLKTRADLVRAHRFEIKRERARSLVPESELKQASARSEEQLYGARLTRRERRRALNVESDIAKRGAMMARPEMALSRRNDRPDMFARAMRRRVRQHGVNRDRGAIRGSRAR